MTHKWTSYHGFTEQFEYCELCDQRKGSHEYNCRAELATHSSSPVRWSYINLLDPNLDEDQVQPSFVGTAGDGEWLKYYTFSSHDDVTRLELEDGRALTPMEMYRESHYGYDTFPTGTKFKFKRIRGEWKSKGLSADEYYNDSAPIYTPTWSGNQGTGPNNQNAGNSSGTQHGQQSSAGLGTVPHSLAYRAAMDEAYKELPSRIYGHFVRTTICLSSDTGVMAV